MRSFLYGKRMSVEEGCFPCFGRQVEIALRLAGAEDGTGERVRKAALQEVASAYEYKTPAHFTTVMHRRIREALGGDPFAGIKAEYNRRAMALYPGLKRLVAESPDPLWTAARLAIAGNVIDFGIYTSVDVEGAVSRALDAPLAVDDYALFRARLQEHDRVLYLLDNTGEVAFDRVLIEELVGMGKRVTAVVKGGPIINDCTLADAKEAGLPGVCEVVDNGSDAVGTILEDTSEAFRVRFIDPASFVISKGQGNLETLLEEEREICFLLQSKCAVLSRVLGVPEGAMLLAANT